MKIRNNLGQFTSKGVTGNLNPKWKGEKVGYWGVHTWVQRRMGKARFCVDCGSSKTVQWANISKEYKRRLNDWKSLCSVCHRKFDNITKLEKSDAEQIKILYQKGVLQKELAVKYKVDQGTISNIVNNKIQYYVS